MSKSRFESTVQIGSTLAILIGLTLVVWELKQTRDLTEAQLISDSLITRQQSNVSLMGENPIAAISKACTASAHLTEEEFHVVRLHYQTKLLESIRRIEIAEASALFDESDWKENATLEFSTIAQTEFGRWWWQVVRSSYLPFQPELVAFGDEVIEASPAPDCRVPYRAYQKHFVDGDA